MTGLGDAPYDMTFHGDAVQEVISVRFWRDFLCMSVCIAVLVSRLFGTAEYRDFPYVVLIDAMFL